MHMVTGWYLCHLLLESMVDCFAVARLEEALSLRSNGIIKPILLLEGFLMKKIYRLLR